MIFTVIYSWNLTFAFKTLKKKKQEEHFSFCFRKLKNVYTIGTKDLFLKSNVTLLWCFQILLLNIKILKGVFVSMNNRVLASCACVNP